MTAPAADQWGLGSGIPANLWSSPAPNICSPMLLISSHVVPGFTYFHCFSGVAASFSLHHHNSEAPRPQFYRWLLRMWRDISGIFLSTFLLWHFLLYLVPGWWECFSAGSLAPVPQLLIVKNEFEYRLHYEWGQYLITTFLEVQWHWQCQSPKFKDWQLSPGFEGRFFPVICTLLPSFTEWNKISEIGICGWWENVSTDSSYKKGWYIPRPIKINISAIN